MRKGLLRQSFLFAALKDKKGPPGSCRAAQMGGILESFLYDGITEELFL